MLPPLHGEMVLVLKVILFLVVVPGTVTVLAPYLFLRMTSEAVLVKHVWTYIGTVPIAAGVYVVLRCAWDFLALGRGTPAPFDPPKKLVVTGFYRFVRNPMYIGVLLVLGGEALMIESLTLLGYAAGFAAGTHLFVVLYEEPTLKKTFGSSYLQYCRSVNRWVPRMPRLLR